MPKKGKKAGGGEGRKGEDGSLDVQQKAGTWETARKEALLKEVRLRAQAEEDRARQKEKILKDKLQKEERNSTKNLFKINEYWARILEQAQTAEQKEEIAIMKATFEREVEELDSIAKDLERKRQEQARRSAQVQHDHQQQMERLCDLHEKRLMLEHQQWGSCILYFDRTQKTGHSETQKVELFAIRTEQKKQTDEMAKVYRQALESCNEFLNLQSENLTVGWEKFERDAKERQKAAQSEEEEEEKVTLKPRGPMKTEQELRADVGSMKLMLLYKRSEQEQQEKEMITARDQAHRDTLKLRDQLSKNRTAARKKLSDLTLHSGAASKKLKALIAKGERIVQKGNICQTLEGKVMLQLPPEIAALGAGTEEAAGEFPELQNLLRRINTATLHGDALKKRRQDLIRENQELNHQLRQLREGNTPLLAISVTPASTSRTRVNTQTGHSVTQGVHLKRPRN